MYISTDGMIGSDRELLDRLCSDGQILESYGSIEGYGHHSTAYVVLLGGAYYSAESSGCSCQGNGTINGPYDSQEAARNALTEYHRSELKPGDVVVESY